jgi:hypothetical protein
LELSDNSFFGKCIQKLKLRQLTENQGLKIEFGLLFKPGYKEFVNFSIFLKLSVSRLWAPVKVN